MKKLFLILTFLSLVMFNSSFATEQTPAFIDNSAIMVKEADDSTLPIDYKNMKKADKIDNSKEQYKPKKKFEIDEKMIEYQRALDYTTNFNNTVVPMF